MLKLDRIKKTYPMADNEVVALKGVSIEFRKSEFVSILGPSGCGKTTLLNIVGGLDRYTSGDLVINGKSTKLYTDKDWDSYRNHSVGFVFQSYNLIPHQTVLENVELALTLSGVGKEERRKRATEVLKKVGLGDKLKQRPNQLSGGQMQRVAIARALVNDPDIILADEPTGALDTNTSEQIMKLLKEISKEKLIVMVTHNPELAEKYSTRIVKLLDGKIIDDSKPYTPNSEEIEEVEKTPVVKKKKSRTTPKTNMSVWMAIMLSVRNLLTKKARTILVSFAGAIGIIGIALVLAISNGFNNYVNNMQEESLVNYPITIQTKSIDLESALASMFAPSNNSKNKKHDNDKIYPREQLIGLFNSIGTSATSNNLEPFYAYLQEHKSELGDDLSAVRYSYNLGYNFFKDEATLTDKSNIQPSSSAMYDLAIMYSLDYFAYKGNVTVTKSADTENPKYIIAKKDTTTDKDLEVVAAYLGQSIANQLKSGPVELPAKVVIGIIQSMMGSFNLENYKTSNSGAFSEMINNEKMIFDSYEKVAGRKISANNEAYLVLDKNSEIDESILFALGLISEDNMNEFITNVIAEKPQTKGIDFNSVLDTEFKVLVGSDYIVEKDGNYINLNELDLNKAEDLQLYNEELPPVFANCENKLKIVGVLRLKSNQTNGILNVGVNYSEKFADRMIAYYNQRATEINNSDILEPLNKDKPNTIRLYATTFEGKNKIKAFIEQYNSTQSTNDQISYSDIAGTLMDSLSTIISSITYVLIAFVSVSLIVSSIMIGIITYISVIERTKEIGVLRSVGASKANIRHVFTAESGIIGLISGILGILVAGLLLIPINLILSSLTGIGGLASLPVLPAFILIGISLVLTLIAGVLPARIAAKRDPVIALRSE